MHKGKCVQNSLSVKYKLKPEGDTATQPSG